MAYADGTLTAKTNLGRYTIRMLRLDRQRLNDLRRLLRLYQEKIIVLEAELERRDLGSERRTALLAHLSDIKPLVTPPVFER